MRAIVTTKYGPPEVLELQEVKTPIPKDDELLIEVHAATVTAGDCEMRRFQLTFLFWLPLRLYMGVFKPRVNVLGQEFSGVVKGIGKDVKNFSVGDSVFGPSDMKFGSYAEYKCISASHPIVKLPSNMSFDEAATIPTGGLNSLHFMRFAKIQPGQKVLIIGAGGSIGTYGLQIAKHKGAEVTAIDSSTKLKMLKSIGADHVIDYEQEDFTKNGIFYDVIFDIVGKGWAAVKTKSLSQNGLYLVTNPGVRTMLRSVWNSIVRNLPGAKHSKRIKNGLAGYKTEDLVTLKELVEEGKLRAVIDKTFNFDETEEAHRYVDTGLKAGNVVISVR